jgi:hypothetical protein
MALRSDDAVTRWLRIGSRDAVTMYVSSRLPGGQHDLPTWARSERDLAGAD